VTEASVDVERMADEAIRVALSGEIDLANIDIVGAELLGAISNQLVDVVVDLSDLTYLDSAGLRVLFELGARLETLQIGFRLVVPPHSTVRRAIDLSGIAAIAAIVPGPRRL
jgi:anti-anti-sigma factor